MKQASDELERKIQAATANIAQQNELLRRQAIQLEQASALKSQFLANMSHEFRTPLNAMLGYTSMLLQGVAGEVEPPVRRQLGRIESNGRHLLTIINEILDISRIEAGRMPLQMSTFKIPDLVNEVKSSSSRSSCARAERDLDAAERSGADLQRSAEGQAVHPQPAEQRAQVHAPWRRDDCGEAQSEGAHGDVVGDRYRHRHRGAGPGPHLRGLPALDNSPTRAYGGTGLGLSICRRLAQMLGGRISVQSQVGKD